jgi:HK97 family phage portal protein
VATVQSFGELVKLSDVTWQSRWVGGSQHSVPLYGTSATLGQLYATQPNVRTCVDFLARNIAQLGVHAFRRVSDTDRVRLPNHDVIRWLERPTPSRATTRYRLIESLVGDLAVYFNAFWLKVPWTDPTGREEIGLLRLPPEEVYIEGGVIPTLFRWTRFGYVNEFIPDQVCYFNGYNTLNEKIGLSPLYTLRRLLAEEAAAGAYRESFWRNAGRFEGIVERPATAPRWSKEQKESWRSQWQERFAGGADAGQTVVLEDGMTYKATSWSAKDAEFIAARKLTREECAAAYHIPPPLVGILEHATFSNITEQHKNLYQDTLGPWLEMIEAGIEAQLLPESSDAANVYIEFNIADKMKGSFEEQAASLQALVGRPIMTANEGRARLNLPRSPDPQDDTLAPQQGGPAAAVHVNAPDPTAASIALVLDATTRRMHGKLGGVPVGDRAAALVATRDRWTRELVADLAPFLRPDDAQRCAAAHVDRVVSVLHLEAIRDW